MNILESLKKIETEIYDKQSKFIDLRGMYLAEDVDKEKLWEMITNNDVKGVIKMLEEDWEDADEEDWNPDDVEDLTDYLDSVDGKLEVNEDEDPKYVIEYPDGSLEANTKQELMDDVRNIMGSFTEDWDEEEDKVFDVDHAEGWTERHPYGYYNNENDCDIDESLDNKIGQKFINDSGMIIEITTPQKNGRPQFNFIKDGKIVDCRDTDSYETLDKILSDNGYKPIK